MLFIVATFLAFYIKGLCGFANTLIFTSILGFGANNVAISPVELVLGYPTNLILTWQNRGKLDKKVFLPLSVLVLIGSIPGAFLLKNVEAPYLKILFGIIVILLGIEMYLRESNKIPVKESKVILSVIGLISGILCGLFGVGALLAAYVGRVTDNAKEFKANISAVFIVENTFRIVLYSALKIINIDSLRQAAILFPVMLLGLFAGIKSSTVINEKYIKHFIIYLLIISGIALILKNI